MCYTGVVTTSLARSIGAPAIAPMPRKAKRMARDPRLEQAISRLDEGLARGDEDAFCAAFGEAVDLVRKLFLGIAKSKGLSLDDAEDVVQDMLLDVYEVGVGKRGCLSGEQIVGLMFSKLIGSMRIPG
ncbi:MAG: hypothetical protein NTU88_10225, partial [Armatimonadetes bacterium]|nr:hypothetical protein [Armatimonadota bacterium]